MTIKRHIGYGIALVLSAVATYWWVTGIVAVTTGVIIAFKDWSTPSACMLQAANEQIVRNAERNYPLVKSRILLVKCQNKAMETFQHALLVYRTREGTTYAYDFTGSNEINGLSFDDCVLTARKIVDPAFKLLEAKWEGTPWRPCPLFYKTCGTNVLTVRGPAVPRSLMAITVCSNLWFEWLPRGGYEDYHWTNALIKVSQRPSVTQSNGLWWIEFKAGATK